MTFTETGTFSPPMWTKNDIVAGENNKQQFLGIFKKGFLQTNLRFSALPAI